jgi:hypothetical protein
VKQAPEPGSQQLVSPGTEGHALWHSASLVHTPLHVGPPPELLPLLEPELLPLLELDVMPLLEPEPPPLLEPELLPLLLEPDVMPLLDPELPPLPEPESGVAPASTVADVLPPHPTAAAAHEHAAATLHVAMAVVLDTWGPGRSNGHAFYGAGQTAGKARETNARWRCVTSRLCGWGTS